MLTQRNIGFFQSDTVDQALPEELVIYILCLFTFRELFPPKCMEELIGSPFLVCKGFQRLVNNDVLWGNIFEQTHGVRITGIGQFTFFKICYQYLQHLEVQHSAIFPGKQAKFEDLHTSVCLYDNDVKHTPWTSFSLGVFNANPVALMQLRGDFIEGIAQSRALLLTSADVHHNPFAMLRLAEEYLEPRLKLQWLEKAAASDCVEAKYQAALQYFDLSMMREYFVLLLQAATRGHAAAANRLTYCYIAKLDEQEYIPLCQEEWEVLAIMCRHTLRSGSEIDANAEVVKEDKSKVITYTLQNIPLAAWYYAKLYESGDVLFKITANSARQAHYSKIAKEAFSLVAAARKERARYWLEEAVKGGNKDAFELVNGTIEPAPPSSKC